MTQAERETANDFLIFRHGDTGFLVDRESFFASVYLEKSDSIVPPDPPSPLPEYLNTCMRYDHETLLIFDLESYLGTLFDCRDTGAMKIALIASVDSFGPEKAAFFRKLSKEVAEGASASRLAFKVGSRAEIIRIPLKDLRRIPASTRKKLEGEGIIGCRFQGRAGVDFIINLCSLVFNNLMPRLKGDGTL